MSYLADLIVYPIEQSSKLLPRRKHKKNNKSFENESSTNLLVFNFFFKYESHKLDTVIFNHERLLKQ